jgi:hypothetical protein
MVRLRQGYGGLDHWPAEASAKAGGLFEKVNKALNPSDAIACPGRGAARNEVEP